MDPDALRSLIPRHKFDCAAAERAIAAGYPAVAPILPELLQWIQDMNWPVAKVLAPFLSAIGAPLVPFLRPILDGNDVLWKYWVIGDTMHDSREIAGAFREEVERIADAPTPDERAEELDGVARRTLAAHGWRTPEIVQRQRASSAARRSASGNSRTR